MEFERELIPLAKLHLNNENDRHGPLTSERESIVWLLEHHRDHMLNLAADIAEHGLSPIDGILVLPAGDEAPGDYYVWEGNRRVAALKLLDDSNRLHDAALRRKFSDLRGKAKTAIPDVVECTVAPSVEEAERLIELRHQGTQEGVGTVAWDARQKERHMQRLGKRGRYGFSHQVVDAISDKVDSELKAKIHDHSFSISTLDRILKNSYAREFLGLSTVSGEPQRVLEEKETLKGLTKVLSDIATGMKVREVYSSAQIRNYLDKFPKQDRPNRRKTLTDPVPLAQPTSSPAPKPKKRSRSLDRDRKRLIPASVTFSIKHNRVNAIYNELRKIDVHNYRNAAAVLFRVFLELSVELYLDEHGVQFSANDKLTKKARKAVDHMMAQNWLLKKGSKGIQTAIDSRHNPHSVDTFHAYVHDLTFQPTPSDLNTAFDNLKPFFDALFDHLE